MVQPLVKQLEAIVRHAAHSEEGQGLIEYSLIAALISIAAIVIMTTLGGNIVTVFTNVSNAL